MSRAITSRTKRLALRVPLVMHRALVQRSTELGLPLASVALKTLQQAGFGYYDGSKGRPRQGYTEPPKIVVVSGNGCTRPSGAPPCGTNYYGWTCCRKGVK